MTETYDVVVIGAGPGGYVAAIRAAQLGQKTAIVDKQWLGGVCLNVGCIPSKALLKNAEVAHTLRERGKEFGFSFDNLTLDFSVAVKRSRQVSNRLVKGVGFLMKKNGIDVYMGTAHLTKPNAVTVTDAEGKAQTLSAKNVIVATGASSMVPPAWKVDGEKVVTYLEAILQERLPKSAIIIGAGAIGVEFATVWNSYGADVTIVEMLPNLVPLEDEEVSAELGKAFKKNGIKALTGHKVESVEATKSGVRVEVSDAEGKTETLEAEQALVAIGFRPNSSDLGLEEVGVKISERGFIEIDERMATNVPGIWAIGDVTGKADAGARRLGDGDRVCREHRRGRNRHAGLRDDAARHVLPAAGGLVRADRSAGEGTRLRSEGGALPVPGQRQGARAGRLRRLGQDRGGREIRRDFGRAHDRPRSDRTAA